MGIAQCEKSYFCHHHFLARLEDILMGVLPRHQRGYGFRTVRKVRRFALPITLFQREFGLEKWTAPRNRPHLESGA